MSDNHSDDIPDWLKHMLAQGVPPVNPAMGAMSPEQGYLQMQALAEQAKAIQQQVAQYQTMMAQQAEIAKMQAQLAQATQTNEQESGNPFDNPMMQQAQAMLDSVMGEEQAGIFKELMGNFGMSDKDFWKGAMVGAAAALILGNENVRKNIVGMLSGTGDLLKTGGETVKDSVTTGSEVVQDTYQAGKAGFKESVARHKSAGADSETAMDTDQTAVNMVDSHESTDTNQG